MPKYYVESGELRKIVEASTPICAAAEVLSAACLQEDFFDMELAKVISVNERGYIRDRPYRRRDAADILLETGTLLSLIAEHDLA